MNKDYIATYERVYQRNRRENAFRDKLKHINHLAVYKTGRNSVIEIFHQGEL